MPLPTWLQTFIRIAAAVLTAQALYVNYFTSAGIPTRWISCALGVIAVVLLLAETVANALTQAGAQSTLVTRLVLVFNGLVAAQGTLVADLAPLSPPQRIIAGIFAGLGAIGSLLALVANVKVTALARRGTLRAT